MAALHVTFQDVVKIHSVLESVYPVDGQMTLVNLTFFPINIIALQEREQRFTLSGWFSATWYDPNLQWDAHKYGSKNDRLHFCVMFYLQSFDLPGQMRHSAGQIQTCTQQKKNSQIY